MATLYGVRAGLAMVFRGRGAGGQLCKEVAGGGMAGDVNAWWTAIDQLDVIYKRFAMCANPTSTCFAGH